MMKEDEKLIAALFSELSESYNEGDVERFTSAFDRENVSLIIKQNIQLVSRRFEIQTIGSETKDVVQGPGVTGRQPILKPGEIIDCVDCIAYICDVLAHAICDVEIITAGCLCISVWCI